jgi:LysM repeat protein
VARHRVRRHVALLQSSFGVTFDQLVAWNHDLHTDCGNLLLGEAYRVQGPSLTTTTTTVSSSTSISTTAPPATSTTSTPSCAQTYTVQDGDYCFKIWSKFHLSEAAFRALNPGLNEIVDIEVGETLCVG